MINKYIKWRLDFWTNQRKSNLIDVFFINSDIWAYIFIGLIVKHQEVEK